MRSCALALFDWLIVYFRCIGRHLEPRNHNCTAKPPLTEGQERMQAAEDRKKKARELLAKNFPNRKR